MQRVRRLIDAFAVAEPEPVMITGETGTGKEAIAREIARRSPRRGGPFVVLNCAELADQVAESELFGHVAGAFTGAVADRDGAFVLAHGGTLLLDEVGRLSHRLQRAILRAVEEGEVRPVGATAPVVVDVRIVAATNAIDELFADLRYRLDVLRIEAPSLRERPEDVPALAEHLLERDGPEGCRRATPAAVAILAGLDWPGNVRELRNVLVRLAWQVVAEGGGRGAVSDRDVERWMGATRDATRNAKSLPEADAQRDAQDVARRLDAVDEAIVSLVRKHPGRRADTLADLAGRPTRTIQWRLARLIPEHVRVDGKTGGEGGGRRVTYWPA